MSSEIFTLETKDLAIKVGSLHLQHLNLAIRPGEFCILAGENGVGKTVFLRSLMGFYKPKQGEIRFFGKPYHEDRTGELNKKIAFVAAEPEIYPIAMRVGSFLNAIRPLYSTWDAVMVEELVRAFNLDLRKRLSTLSLGEHLKVRLVKALAFQPEFLILDELTANLSPNSKDAVLQCLLGYFEKKCPAVLYVSHSKHEMRTLGDRLIILKDGSLIEEPREVS